MHVFISINIYLILNLVVSLDFAMCIPNWSKSTFKWHNVICSQVIYSITWFSGSLPPSPYNVAAIPFTHSYVLITWHTTVMTTLNSYLLDKLGINKIKYFTLLYFFLWCSSFLSLHLSFFIHIIDLLSEECLPSCLEEQVPSWPMSSVSFVWESISPSLRRVTVLNTDIWIGAFCFQLFKYLTPIASYFGG